MLKKNYPIFFLCILVFLILWLLFQSSKNQALVIGSLLPEIEYDGSLGQTKIRQHAKPLILVYFNTACEHCRYQLAVFDKHINKFKESDIYFLTIESDFFQTQYGIEWSNLTQARNIQFGIVSKTTISRIFGAKVTPSLFFFDASGELKHKIRGEIKAEKILEIMHNLTSGRTQSAAINNVPLPQGQ